MNKNKRSIGADAENIACKHLLSKGYKILEKNFYCRLGEIDIIAKDKDYTVFIEVKFRSTNQFGYPGEAVNFSKQKTIIKVAKYYSLINNIYNTNLRFDVVEIMNNDINLIQNAFSAV